MTVDRGTVDADLRRLAPQVLGALMRRHRGLDVCEDAVQEALLAAATEWPTSGVPTDPRGWLVTVASRRLIDRVRSDQARRAREDRVAAGGPRSDETAGAAPEGDDSLVLLLLCCHPALTAPSQIALTLRAVGGLTTAEIARAFFVPEATMAQRVSRAKQRIRDAGATFAMPPAEQLDERLRAVIHVLYLIFNEGYTASAGPELNRVDLTSEAIRLARELHRLRPTDAEAQALLALMLLTDARRPARTGPDGELIPLAEQDRAVWDGEAISEGVALVSDALARGALGAYQLQAAIAAVHDEAARVEDTDWPQIVGLYEILERVARNPMVTINHAVAVGEARGPEAGLALLATVADDDRVANHHLLYAVRGHLLEMAGDPSAAKAFRVAARLTSSRPERRYLTKRANRAATENI